MDITPEDLSSDWTFVYKFLFAPLWIGGFGAGTVAMLVASSHDTTAPGRQENPWATFIVLFLAGTVYLYWTCIRLKAVRMDSGFLYVSNFRKEIKIPLSVVARVSEWRLDNTHPVFVHFAQPTEFGTSIVFMPKIRWFGFWSSHPVVDRIRQSAGQGSRHPY